MSDPVVACLLVAAERHGDVQVVPAVQVKAGSGIVGDRFFSRSARHPERNITLIEAEAIEAVAAALALSIPVTAPRRNVVTRGIRLNELVGRTFMAGPVTLRGIELCEPCIVLGRQLETATCSRDTIIRAFLRRGGLRATIVTSGVIRAGDAIRI